MRVWYAALVAAAFTAAFTLFGWVSFGRTGRPEWAGAAVGAVLGLLMGTGAVYPRAGRGR